MTASTHHNRRVLVLGEDARMVLPIVRSLGRKGVSVEAGWLPADSPVLRSRHLTRAHNLPSFHGSSREAIRGLRGLLTSNDYQLVVPVGESVICLLQQHRDDLRDCGRIWLHDPELFQLANDKSEMHAMAARLGISTPHTVIVSREFEIDAAIEQFEPPIVVKATRSTSNPSATKSFVEVHSAHEPAHRAARKQLAQGHTVLFQSYLTGHGVGVEFLAWHGTILAAFQHSRLHETTGHGSTYRLGEKVDSCLLESARALVSELRYTGVGMCEFRVDPAANTRAFIELNPRFWGSLPLAVASGADFPWFLYQLLVDGVREFPQAFKVGKRCRDLRGDLRWLSRACWGGSQEAALHADQGEGWGINGRGRTQLAGDLLRFALLRDGIDSFAWDDPVPFFSELWSMVRHYASPPRFRRHVREGAIQTAWSVVRFARSE